METETMGDWNPALYIKYEAERTRAASDLLAQSPLREARRITDLGCGPGNSAALLAKRYPSAEIEGVDRSASMLDYARKRAPTIRFTQQDIAQWRPNEPPDLIFSNAALHFLHDHHLLMPRLLSYLAPDGCLAVQMPDLAREGCHAAMRMAAVDGPWASKLAPVVKSQPVLAPAEAYYEWLRPYSRSVNIWMTIYVHPLEGVNGIVDWFAGSALRAYLDPLDESERGSFLAVYRRHLEGVYPLQSDGKTLLAYPRLFIVAERG